MPNSQTHTHTHTDTHTHTFLVVRKCLLKLPEFDTNILMGTQEKPGDVATHSWQLPCQRLVLPKIWGSDTRINSRNLLGWQCLSTRISSKISHIPFWTICVLHIIRHLHLGSQEYGRKLSCSVSCSHLQQINTWMLLDVYDVSQWCAGSDFFLSLIGCTIM